MSNTRIRVVQLATGNVGSGDGPTYRRPSRPRTGRPLLLLARENRSRRRRNRRAWRHSGSPPPAISTTSWTPAGRRELQWRLAGRRPVLRPARGRHQRRHHVRLDYRAPPRPQPPAPFGHQPTELIEAACRAGGATFYGTGMNPGPGPDPERRGDGRHGPGGPHHRAGDRRRVVPPLGRHLEERRLRATRGRPRGPGPAREGLHRLRRLDLPDGRLPRPADRRRRVRVRARRLHRGGRPRLVDPARRFGRGPAWPSSRGCRAASPGSRCTSSGR